MDFPPAVVSDHQQHAAAARTDHVPSFFKFPSSLLADPYYDYETVLDLDFSSSEPYISFNDVSDKNNSTVLCVDTSATVAKGMPPIQSGHGAQLDCKLVVCSRASPGVTSIHAPAPSGQVVELQHDLPQQPDLQHDIASGILPSKTAALSMSTNIFACHESPPASSFSPSSYQFAPYPYHMYSKDDKLPQLSLSYNFHEVEANHTEWLPFDYDAVPAETQLTKPPHYPLLSSVGMECHSSPAMLNVAASPTANAYGAKSGIMFPVHMHRDIFNPDPPNLEDSAALEMSSASAPTPALASSLFRHQLIRLSKDDEKATIPSSPTPSVNKAGKQIRRRRSCESSTSCKVAIIVEDAPLNLADGFIWRKYGMKAIKGCNFPKSYFRCKEHHRHECMIRKCVQKTNDGQHTCFTYIGRHTHS